MNQVSTYVPMSKFGIGGSGVNAILGRDLNNFLGSKCSYSTWFKDQVKRNELIENTDFAVLNKNVVNQNKMGRPRIDHMITVGAAKKIAMRWSGEKGNQARDYFLECEGAVQQMIEAPKPMAVTSTQALLQAVQALVDHEAKIDSMMHRIEALESKQNTIHMAVSPEIEVPEIDTKGKINMMVRGYAANSKFKHSVIYGKLYSEFKYRYHLDLVARAKKDKKTAIKIAEELGVIENLYALAKKLFQPLPSERNLFNS